MYSVNQGLRNHYNNACENSCQSPGTGIGAPFGISQPRKRCYLLRSSFSPRNFPLERPKKSRSMIFLQFFVVLHTIEVEGVLHRIFRVRVRHPVLQMAIPDPVLEQNI